ncbi:hypothetical protein Ddc_16673 [Ditylenchus destructor]|nr:hypothetical protein Ddc_16673 [Ditylenchus destructor]
MLRASGVEHILSTSSRVLTFPRMTAGLGQVKREIMVPPAVDLARHKSQISSLFRDGIPLPGKSNPKNCLLGLAGRHFYLEPSFILNRHLHPELDQSYP